MKDAPTALPLQWRGGVIRFENVRFNYPEAEGGSSHNLLKPDLSAPAATTPGTQIAIAARQIVTETEKIEMILAGIVIRTIMIVLPKRMAGRQRPWWEQ
jgi:hypothetical protein